MSPQYFSTMSSQGYASLWNKYRPAIPQLMIAAEDGPQEYKFFKHEFKALNPKEKAYAFVLEAHQGKAVNDIEGSAPAKDLLGMLMESPKASELMDAHVFEFSLDKQFVLHIAKRNATDEGQGAVSENPLDDDDNGNA